MHASTTCAVIVLQQTSLSAVGNVGVIFQQFNEAQVSDTEFVIAACVMVLQFRRVGTRCFTLYTQAENAKLKEEVAQWKSDNQQLLQTNAEVRHNCVCVHGSMQCQPYSVNHCHGWFTQVVSKSDDYCQAEQRLQAEVNRLKVKAHLHNYVAISILLQECFRVIG